MNLSRAYTLACGTYGDEAWSVGRVQTPTLAMVVERDLAIRAFVPEDYREVVATFAPLRRPLPSRRGLGEERGERKPRYQGVWFRGERPEPKAKRLPADGKEAPASSPAPGGNRPLLNPAPPKPAAPPALAVRPDRIAAPRQPAVRLQRAERRWTSPRSYTNSTS
jgi:hypothetical protein